MATSSGGHPGDVEQMTAPQLAGRIGEVLGQIKTGALNGNHLNAFIEHRDPFAAPKTTDVDVNDRVAWWLAHYRSDVYRMNPDFSDINILPRDEGYKRLVIMPKGMTLERWLNAVRNIHGVSFSDEALLSSYGGIIQTYGFWIKDDPEPDFPSMDSRHAATNWTSVTGVTLLERLVAGTAYLFEKGRHMDMQRVTICTGSPAKSFPTVQMSTHHGAGSSIVLYIGKINEAGCSAHHYVRTVATA